MSRVYFSAELEGVATCWRIARRDGVSLGFTSHDRDLWIDGLLHRAAPGMVPAAISRRADLSADSAEIDAALTHDAITHADLETGRYDGARITVGVADWETLEYSALYHGTMGTATSDGTRFNAELLSAKHRLLADPIARTSPACRAAFCGKGCGLSAPRYTHEAVIAEIYRTDAFDPESGPSLGVTGVGAMERFAGGALRWIDGPHSGLWAAITGVTQNGRLHIDALPQPAPPLGSAVLLREGCDHTLRTCHARFANARNFRGEPFLPGNDQLVRRPVIGD